MGNLAGALAELRAERERVGQQLEKLGEAISVLETLDGSRTSVQGRLGKRVVSAASRQKMALVQRARWAKVKGASSPSNEPISLRKPMSIAARRKIAAAQRARWAKQKAA